MRSSRSALSSRNCEVRSPSPPGQFLASRERQPVGVDGVDMLVTVADVGDLVGVLGHRTDVTNALAVAVYVRVLPGRYRHLLDTVQYFPGVHRFDVRFGRPPRGGLPARRPAPDVRYGPCLRLCLPGDESDAALRARVERLFAGGFPPVHHGLRSREPASLPILEVVVPRAVVPDEGVIAVGLRPGAGGERVDAVGDIRPSPGGCRGSSSSFVQLSPD